MITGKRLRERLSYDPETGVFTWRQHPENLRPGVVAGCLNRTGYIRIHIDGRIYGAHRLAWLYMRRRWPIRDLDHVNCVRNDNRFVNLRMATRGESARNRTRRVGSVGLKGVYRRATKRRWGQWGASIFVNGRKLRLGLFPTAEAAHAAYRTAAVKHHGAFARFD